jgi:hypothetical protein
MCWVKLPRHPGRAHAWPFCGRYETHRIAVFGRPGRDAHQPLDRPGASLTNPGLRDVRCAHIAPPLGCLGVAFFGGWPL